MAPQTRKTNADRHPGLEAIAALASGGSPRKPRRTPEQIAIDKEEAARKKRDHAVMLDKKDELVETLQQELNSQQKEELAQAGLQSTNKLAKNTSSAEPAKVAKAKSGKKKKANGTHFIFPARGLLMRDPSTNHRPRFG